ncbi:hypothetical protein [Nocardia shimofusensis]|uniref:hypothetical protein n=1 Tax=Nocardia shimofusensis TaxID=228596 RepID=UPI00082D21BE|nr:hypothetical protein [Nocardia shimofusensis]
MLRMLGSATAHSVPLSVLTAAAAVVLTGCGESESTATSPGSGAAGDGKPSVELVASGFGQSGNYAQGVVVVTTDSEASVGEHVTASVNFLDSAGAIIKTESQVESFSWIGQQLVLPVWLDLSSTPGVGVAAIEPSVAISEYGFPKETRQPLPSVESESIGQVQFQGTVASFTFTNPTSEDLPSPRVGVACYDTAGAIIGGGYDYPDLAPAGKAIRIDASVKTSGDPARCTAFPNYG